MDREAFEKFSKTALRDLFSKARTCDELAFLFSILGINAGVENPGWQPIEETQSLVQDLVNLINAPLNDYTKIRLMLLVYCHVTEANFMYHCLYNMLLTIEGQPPKVFSFLDMYRNGVPPSVGTKLKEIKAKSLTLDNGSIAKVLDEIFKPEIRNAFFHSDYILHEAEIRLKHRGGQYEAIPFSEVTKLLEKTLTLFTGFMNLLGESRRSFPKGYVIRNRKRRDGGNLGSVEVLVDEETGIAVGFSGSDPLPIW